ncbi:hypothetical protein VNO78_16064 [Psophocarpus tetragonolobus]|uniref:Uncharacterized protein n=1 Tax=Psophocarpus tetragonolobus TaxID=3891 RepID=A0AAN9XK54_PSOTE
MFSMLQDENYRPGSFNHHERKVGAERLIEVKIEDPVRQVMLARVRSIRSSLLEGRALSEANKNLVKPISDAAKLLKKCVPWCAPTPSKFTIVRGDDQQGEQFSVKLSGSSENTVSGSFSFQSANYYGLGLKLKSWRRYAYTLVFCTDDGTCRGVGIYADRYGNLRLVLTQRDPVVLQIRSVTPYAAASA